jgi:hypothetical protein
MTVPDAGRRPLGEAGVGATVTGAVAAFGLVVASTLVAVVAAGAMQWVPALPRALDSGIPLLLLVAGLCLAGRITVDVAGSHAVLAAAGAAGLIGALGLALSSASEAHGDSVEPPWVALAAACVFVCVGGSAWLVRHRRATGSD